MQIQQEYSDFLDEHNTLFSKLYEIAPDVINAAEIMANTLKTGNKRTGLESNRLWVKQAWGQTLIIRTGLGSEQAWGPGLGSNLDYYNKAWQLKTD